MPELSELSKVSHAPRTTWDKIAETLDGLFVHPGPELRNIYRLIGYVAVPVLAIGAYWAWGRETPRRRK